MSAKNYFFLNVTFSGFFCFFFFLLVIHFTARSTRILIKNIASDVNTIPSRRPLILLSMSCPFNSPIILISVNHPDIVGIRVQSLFGAFFRFFFFHSEYPSWTSYHSKVKESTQPCYLTHSWNGDMNSYVFPKKNHQCESNRLGWNFKWVRRFYFLRR